MATAEQRARANIDKLLEQAGWSVQDLKAANLLAARGVALREFERNPGHGASTARWPTARPSTLSEWGGEQLGGAERCSTASSPANLGESPLRAAAMLRGSLGANVVQAQVVVNNAGACRRDLGTQNR
jgi:hypothetical protein